MESQNDYSAGPVKRSSASTCIRPDERSARPKANPLVSKNSIEARLWRQGRGSSIFDDCGRQSLWEIGPCHRERLVAREMEAFYALQTEHGCMKSTWVQLHRRAEVHETFLTARTLQGSAAKSQGHWVEALQKQPNLV